MKEKIFGTFLIFAFAGTAFAGDALTAWPSLTNVKFVSGRAANLDDIKNEKAAFVLQSDGKAIGVPLNIKVPQYAYHVDSKTGKKTKVIVIQAEEAQGKKVVGAMFVDSGAYMAGLLNEFKLLGVSVPNE